MGFTIVEGDKWAERPEINFFGGGMLRPAVEEGIREFEKREGVIVKTTFNGRNFSRSNERGIWSMLFSCDRKFMEIVQDRFEGSTDITSNDIVIAVEIGNPKGIKTLDDLLSEGVKVGLGH